MPVRPYGLTGTALRAAFRSRSAVDARNFLRRNRSRSAVDACKALRPNRHAPAGRPSGRIRYPSPQVPFPSALLSRAESGKRGKPAPRENGEGNGWPISPLYDVTQSAFIRSGASSVCNASRFKPCGLAFCGNTTIFPLALGLTTLCRPPRVLPFSKAKRLKKRAVPEGTAQTKTCCAKLTAASSSAPWPAARSARRCTPSWRYCAAGRSGRGRLPVPPCWWRRWPR